MNKTILVFFLLMLTSDVFSQTSIPTEKIYCPTKNKAAQLYFQAAQEAIGNNNLAKASDLLIKSIDADSLFCDAWDELGVVFRHMGRNNEAISCYYRALNIDTNDLMAAINVGGIWLLQDSVRKAYPFFALATMIDSTDPEGYYGLAKVYYGVNNADMAKKNIDRTIECYRLKNKRVDNDVRFLEGLIDLDVEDIPNSKKILLYEYDNFSNNAHMNFSLGLCYLKCSEPDKKIAKKYFRKAEKEGAILPKEIKAVIE